MIRVATLDDTPAIRALWNDVISTTTITFTTQEKSHADVAALIKAPWPVLVAERQGAFAGFASLSTFRNGPGYAQVAEHTIYLVQNARGAGLGTSLLCTLEETAAAAGLHTLIGAVSGSNPQAVAFHKRAGFSQVGHLPEIGRKWGQTLDLKLMQKNLPHRPDTLGCKG